MITQYYDLKTGLTVGRTIDGVFYKRTRANRSAFNASLSNCRVLRAFTEASPVRPINAARRWCCFCTLREGATRCQTAAAEDGVKRRPRTSEPSSLRPQQLSSKQPSITLSPTFMMQESMTERQDQGVVGKVGSRYVKSITVLLG